MAVELVLFCTREKMSIFPVYELECSEMALATSSVEFLPPSPRRVRVTAATGHVAGAHPAFGDHARDGKIQTWHAQFRAANRGFTSPVMASAE